MIEVGGGDEGQADGIGKVATREDERMLGGLKLCAQVVNEA